MTWHLPTRVAASALMALTLAGAAESAETSAWDFSLTRLEGGTLPLREFAGHPVLLVNTASLCGYTYQYDALQALWTDNRQRGLVVLGVPSGDFADQEYDTSGEIKEFCQTNFALDFPMSEREHVRGPDAHPLYRWLAETLGDEAVPGWNFHKILIGPDGMPLAAWDTRTEPDDPAITAAIDKALAASGRPSGS